MFNDFGPFEKIFLLNSLPKLFSIFFSPYLMMMMMITTMIDDGQAIPTPN